MLVAVATAKTRLRAMSAAGDDASQSQPTRGKLTASFGEVTISSDFDSGEARGRILHKISN